ncbi:hypothetical protein [Candidatus Vidania fulgoroideorum]
MIKLLLAEKRKIISWSFGEIKNSETINYRTLKPEPNGLFCQKIFGNIKKFECACSKFKKSNIKNNVCILCGVNIKTINERRYRMGHITLETPLIHIWLFKVMPSIIGNILQMTVSNLEKIIYYDRYVITNSKNENVKKGTLLSEKEYYNYKIEYGSDIEIESGAKAIESMLLKTKINEKNKKIIKKFKKNKLSLDSLILYHIPVLPAGLRPIVKLKNGKFASSDINEFYKTIINRNNRLKRMQNIGAPEFIIRNEKKLLQISVDCLFDNGRKQTMLKEKIPLKSLADCIKGKKGRFRQNLLGKRVDYSARAVITVEPKISINDCGIPINIGIEIFRPFIYRYLVKNGLSKTLIDAKNEVDYKSNKSIYALKKIVKNRYIILNRAPTLHKLGIQSFKIYLVKDNAIHIHPLVCTSFNADFDGDQMAVHIPLSKESFLETKYILSSSRNIYFPSNGNISIMPTQDMILGIYYISRDIFSKKILYFSCYKKAINYYYIKNKNFSIYFLIKKGKYIKTTLLRMFLYKILPYKDIFLKFNKELGKNEIYSLIKILSNKINRKKIIIFIEKLAKLGFKFSTEIGLSISLCDLKINRKRKKIINFYFKIIKFFGKNFWELIIFIINKISILKLKFKKKKKFNNIFFVKRNNNLSYMLFSKSRGTEFQILQLNGSRGIMLKADGKKTKIPIISNLKTGMNDMQYFVSSYGARKGLSDTSLKTATSGYLTRRLVDVSQNVVINKIDCLTKDYITYETKYKYINRFYGYYINKNIYYKGKLLFRRKNIFNCKIKKILLKKKIKHIFIRSPIICKLNVGICAYCYGSDIKSNRRINLGEAVGIIAAQSIGEPGTQLTMRTFHTGGVFNREIINKRYFFNKNVFYTFSHNAIYEKIKNKKIFINNPKFYFFNLNGQLIFKKKTNKNIYCKNLYSFINFYKDIKKKKYINFFKIKKILLKYNNNFLKKKFIYENKKFIFYFKKFNYLNFYKNYKKFFIIVNKKKIKINKKKTSFSLYYKKKQKTKKDITGALEKVSNYFEVRKNIKKCIFSYNNSLYKKTKFFIKSKNIKIKTGLTKIKKDNIFLKGEKINKGNDDKEKLKIIGKKNFSDFFVNKIKNIYKEYGVEIHNKHIEIILRQMIKKKIINKKKNIYRNNFTGITKSSLTCKSFISAASFQEATKVLINSAIYGRIDYIRGIKENVILGRIIPAGTGFFYYVNHKPTN